jgi:hypothetical protein
MANKFSFKKAYTVIPAIILGLILIVVLYSYYLTHSSSINFQEYKPNYLPGNNKVTSYNQSVFKPESVEPSYFSYNKQLIYDLGGWNAIIEQNNKNINFSYSCQLEEGMADTKCTLLRSPSGQPYQLIVSYGQTNPTEPFDENISFLKGSTNISIDLQGNPVHIYPNSVWGKVVDSFSKVHYSSIKIIRSESND